MEGREKGAFVNGQVERRSSGWMGWWRGKGLVDERMEMLRFGGTGKKGGGSLER